MATERTTGTEQAAVKALFAALNLAQYKAVSKYVDGRSGDVICEIERIGDGVCVDLYRKSGDSYVLAFGAFVGPRGALNDKRGYCFAGSK